MFGTKVVFMIYLGKNLKEKKNEKVSVFGCFGHV